MSVPSVPTWLKTGPEIRDPTLSSQDRSNTHVLRDAVGPARQRRTTSHSCCSRGLLPDFREDSIGLSG